MKITVLHGDHTTASRKRLNSIVSRIKKRGWEIFRTNQSSGLSRQLTAGSLFSQESLFVHEDANKIGAADLKWLSQNFEKVRLNLLIWHKKEIGKRIIQAFPKDVRFEKFDLPQKIFKFLDSLYPGNRKEVINLFHELLLVEPTEFIFALMARLFRDLYWVKIEPQTLSYPSWRMNKLKKQANLFPTEKLTQTINQLAEIDIAVKTGKRDLITSLDLLIISQLD